MVARAFYSYRPDLGDRHYRVDLPPAKHVTIVPAAGPGAGPSTTSPTTAVKMPSPGRVIGKAVALVMTARAAGGTCA